MTFGENRSRVLLEVRVSDKGRTWVLSCTQVKIKVRTIKCLSQALCSQSLTTTGVTRHQDVLATDGRTNQILPLGFGHKQLARFKGITIANIVNNFGVLLRNFVDFNGCLVSLGKRSRLGIRSCKL